MTKELLLKRFHLLPLAAAFPEGCAWAGTIYRATELAVAAVEVKLAHLKILFSLILKKREISSQPVCPADLAQSCVLCSQWGCVTQPWLRGRREAGLLS